MANPTNQQFQDLAEKMLKSGALIDPGRATLARDQWGESTDVYRYNQDLHAEREQKHHGSSVSELLIMIGYRLHRDRRHRDLRLGFEFIAPVRVSPEQVVVFVVQNNKPVTLTDDWSLFPSDALITQLRLLEKA